MKRVNLNLLSLFIVLSLLAGSCVSSKRYNELQLKRDLTKEENAKLKHDNETLQTRNNECTALNNRYNQIIIKLKKDTTDLGIKHRRLSSNYRSLNKNYQDLLGQNQVLISGNQTETKNILAKLQQSQADLLKREDSLAVLEREYADRKAELESMQKNLLKNKAAYSTLMNEVARKDSLMKELKNSVAGLTG